MKAGLRNACVSSAVIATLYGPAAVMARDLLWDPTGTSAGGTDGGGTWTTGINPNTGLQDKSWVDPAALPAPTNVSWSNANPDSATFGISTANVTPPAPLTVLLGSNIDVQNWNMASASTGAWYNFFDQGDGGQTLTLHGNIQKLSAVGTPQVLFTNAIQLTAGNHIVALRDSPGSGAAELSFNSGFAGSGSLTLDNTYNFGGNNTEVQFGILALNADSTYTGGTNVVEGRLLANTNTAMGTGAVTVSGGGNLGFGGNGTTVGNLTINNPITITRSDYSSGDAFNKYTEAVVANNDGSQNTITLAGQLTIDSTDARINSFSNRIIISSNIASNTGGTLVVGGDSAGFIELTGNNAGLATGGIRTTGGVQLDVTSEANLGGPTSPLTFNGGVFHPIGGFLTDFGTHPINNATFNGSINVDDGKTFTINQPLGQAATAVGGLSKRGTGTLNITKGVNLRGGASFYDAGIVNIVNDGTPAVGDAPASGTVSLSAVRIRSATFNVPAGTTLITANNFSGIGVDTAGTNGNPDSGVMNIAGTGTFGDGDFNVSDNARTTGVLTLTGAATVTIAGNTYFGKGNNASSTVTMGGSSTMTIGTPTANRFLRIGGNGATGSFVKSSSGSLTINGELQVGNTESALGVGSFTQTAGSTTVTNWFSTGRFGGAGTTLISGGTLLKNGANNSYVGQSNRNATSTFTVNGTGAVTIANGEFWAGNEGGIGILNITDNGSFSVNSWLALGRANVNSYGELNLSGSGTLTKTGGNFLAIGSGGTGTLTQTGSSTMTINGTRIAENSNGTMNLLGGTSTFTGEFSLGYNANRFGFVTIANNHNSTMPDVVIGNIAGTGGGTLNLDGGTLSVNSIRRGNATGAPIVNWNGTQVIARSTQTNWIGGLIQSNVGAGGMKVNTAGFDVTVNSNVNHAAALGATVDGGLTKSGSGRLILAGSATYTGGTVVSGGTLELAATAQAPALTNAAGTDIQAGAVQFNYTTSPASTIRGLLASSFQAATTPGIMDTGTLRSSTATTVKGLGYRDNGTNVLVKVALFGDADLDGGVSINDFNALAGNFGQSTGKVWVDGDFDYDGGVSINDFNLLAGGFGQSLPPTSEAWAGLLAFAAAHNDLVAFEAVTGVPEPTSLGLIAAGATLGLRRRRRAK